MASAFWRALVLREAPRTSFSASERLPLLCGGHFPTDAAAMKLLYLALRNVSGRWGPIAQWKRAALQFSIRFGDRMPA